jgi:hypothetical protein
MSPPAPSQPEKSRSLKREIAVILIIKVIVLYGIWALWFDQPMPKEQRLEKTTRIILNK